VAETGSTFELAHVLFMDVVGYSQMPIDDQCEILRDLNAIVRGTEQFRAGQGLAIDPLSLPMRTKLGACYILLRRYPEAIDSLRKTIELNPSFAQAQDQLGLALELSGDLDGAAAQFENSFRASGGDFHALVFLANLYGVKGERAKAEETLQKAREAE
jgi:tetratricopeptide (TPR) repeat protein